MLTVKNLHCQVQDKEILKDVSASFPKGKITAIVGPNGCGKSTLMSFLCKARQAQSAVFLEGRDVAEITAAEYAQRVAMMPQQREVMADLKVRDIVVMGRFPFKQRFQDYSDKDYELAAQAMENAGVTGLADRHIGRLSGGEVQRVLIAKTFAQQPELILLDEPTNHLDVKYKVQLMRDLRAYGGTVVLVLHDLSLVVQYCDEVLVMTDGRPVCQGKAGEVMKPELLEQVFGVPFVSFEQAGHVYLNY